MKNLKKKWFLAGIVLLGIITLFIACDIFDDISITSVSVTVTAPATGSTPNIAATGSGKFSVGAVSWAPNDNPFNAETQYTATVTLTANSGYTFNGLTAATINGNTATITNNKSSAVTLSYRFPRMGWPSGNILSEYSLSATQPQEASNIEWEVDEDADLIMTLTWASSGRTIDTWLESEGWEDRDPAAGTSGTGLVKYTKDSLVLIYSSILTDYYLILIAIIDDGNTNPIAGKTWYDGTYYRTVFANNGTFITLAKPWSGGLEDSVAIASGTYTVNESANTITLTTTRESNYEWDSDDTELKNVTPFNTTLHYTITSDAMLLIQKGLPVSVGTNELSGKTFEWSSMMSYGEYTFTDAEYTFTRYYYGDGDGDGDDLEESIETGTYSFGDPDEYSSADGRVYFKPEIIEDKTMSQYYDSVSTEVDEDYWEETMELFGNEAVTKAALTNSAFSMYSSGYSVEVLKIGGAGLY